MSNKKYTLVYDNNFICTSKCIIYENTLGDNEVEITEEQYNQITEFPLKLTIEDGKVVSWEKTAIEYPIADEPVKEPTIEERLTIAEDTINFLLGL